jgi:Fe-S oxidoreductase
MAWAEGVAPESVKRALEGWEREGNPFGRDLGRVLREAVPPSLLQPEAQILVLAGCATLALNPGVLGDLARLLGALGLDMVGVLPPEPVCCGGMLLELGDQEGFRRAASALYARISRAKKVLTLCPHCLHTLKSRYGWLDPALGNRVFHISQFLLECLPETLPPGRSAGRMIYHDPCVLGRHLGLYDPPRALLSRVLADGVPEEYPRKREHAECCGGGGAFPWCIPKTPGPWLESGWSPLPTPFFRWQPVARGAWSGSERPIPEVRPGIS